MSGNQQNHEEQTRERAYILWEQEGKPEGRHEEFWHRAMAEVAKSQERGTKELSSPDKAEAIPTPSSRNANGKGA
jgi:hypothetical protein